MIDILLSTYNGEKFLCQQIESIISQTYKDWFLTIRDDGSTDDTLNIIESFTSLYPDKIKLVDKGSPNLGPSKSFERLLHFAKHEYIMFCDQDDVWLDSKIDITLKTMQQFENESKDTPLLVCTDVTCISTEGEVLYNSFFKSRKFLDVALKNDNTFLAMNIVQGCTMMINAVCLKYILPFPNGYGHDAYIGAVINHFGKVFYLHKQTMLYRQHLNNVYGAPSVNELYFLDKIKHFFKILSDAQKNYNQLPFKTSKWKWIVYKIYFSIKRCFL